MVLLNDIYVTVDASRYMIYRKAEELNTPIDCSKSFNGTLQCYTTGFDCRPYAHCKVTCTSEDWTYFYLYNTAWHNNIPVKFYVSPMTPTNTSKVMKEIKCSNRYNITTKECISLSDYSTYITLSCKLKCTSIEDSYMLQSDIIFDYINGKHYKNDHSISNYEPWKPMGKTPAIRCKQRHND